MKDSLMNHRVTVLLRPDVCSESRIITEGDGIDSHIKAYENIDNILVSKHIPPIARGIDNIDGIIHAHLNFGNTVIHNMCMSGLNQFLIFMPEDINSLDKNVVRGFVKLLSDVETISIYQQVGENHIQISVDEFLHPKAKLLDTFRHNNKNSNQKGLNI